MRVGAAALGAIFQNSAGVGSAGGRGWLRFFSLLAWLALFRRGVPFSLTGPPSSDGGPANAGWSGFPGRSCGRLTIAGGRLLGVGGEELVGPQAEGDPQLVGVEVGEG